MADPEDAVAAAVGRGRRPRRGWGSSVLVAVAAALALAWYAVEPWAVTFVDDGPYYSRPFDSPVGDLHLESRVDLRRFGRVVYTLESRTLAGRDEIVLVLRDASGSVRWARLPVKPDGELGSLEIRRARLTWYGGWRVRIVPANQEPGDLYLGALGGFRFFNHSW